MPRPSGGYRNKAQDRIPGTSSIAKIIGEPESLIYWAHQQGLAGLDYRETRDSAATAGSMVHAAAEAWKRRQPYAFVGDAAVIKKAQTGYHAFLEWANQTKLIIEETEVSLVSEVYQYGGTFDATLIGDDKRRVICEYKTASGLYPEHLLQIAGYAALWNENFPEKPITGGHYVLRFNRDYGDFTASWFGELEDAWQAFLRCRELYDLRAKVKARCR
jgi:hypothetical protein